jgi:hypothetical protein
MTDEPRSPATFSPRILSLCKFWRETITARTSGTHSHIIADLFDRMNAIRFVLKTEGF